MKITRKIHKAAVVAAALTPIPVRKTTAAALYAAQRNAQEQMARDAHAIAALAIADGEVPATGYDLDLASFRWMPNGK